MMKIAARIAAIGLCTVAICFGTTRSQVFSPGKADDALPPLPLENLHKPNVRFADNRKSTRLAELELLIPAIPLICWSHSSAENPERAVVVSESGQVEPPGLPRAIVFDPLFPPPVHNAGTSDGHTKHHLCF
jgi:hypothetical protein